MRGRRPSLRGLWLAALGALLLGCSGPGDTSLQLQFVVTPELNSERQLLEGIDTLELVLDATAGFAGVSAANERFGPLRAVDDDGDKVLELVLERSLRQASSLPRLRLLPGHNLDRSFRLTVQGLKGGIVTAAGGLQSTGFAPGEHRDVLVPFNLRAKFRAPRVVLSLPQDGHSAPSAPAEIYVQFSKEVTVPAGELRLVPQASGSPTWSTSSVTVQELGFSEKRTVARLELGTTCALSPGTVRIEATPKIKDLTGTPLDQDASTPGLEGYSASFTVIGAPTTDCACQTDADCGVGFACDRTSGRCTTTMTSCGASAEGCPAGYVCSPTENTCVDDCRTASLDVCLFAGTNWARCNPNTGLCEPCEDATCPTFCTIMCSQYCGRDLPQQSECLTCLAQYGCPIP